MFGMNRHKVLKCFIKEMRNSRRAVLSGNMSCLYNSISDCYYTRPLIHLLHTINQYCVMKKRDLFAMKERDLRFNKTVKFSLSVANLRNRAMLYGSLDIYL